MKNLEGEDDWTQPQSWMQDMPKGMPAGPTMEKTAEAAIIKEQPNETIIVLVVQPGPAQA